MLNFTQAIDFLSNVLLIENVDFKVQHQRLQLLCEYAARFHQHIPFQNLSLLELESEDRAIPTNHKVIQDCFAKIGGICYTLSAFTNDVLHALGYDSSLVLCTCVFVTSPNTHVATIIKNVERSQDLYFLDVGTSFPTFQPIPVHDLPQVYNNAFLRYKFVREDSLIVRYHASEKDAACEWHKYYQFEPIARDEEYLRRFQHPVYTSVGHADSWYLTGLRITLYPKEKAITLNNYILKLWTKGETIQTKQLKDKVEIERAIRTYFPMLEYIDISKALSRITL